MLRITESKGHTAKHYFIKSKGDYYLERGESQERIGHWGGRLAAEFGLSGEVDKASFDSLVDGYSPLTRENLTPRIKGDRRSGYDLTFDLSKGLSLYYSLTRDERVMVAFDEAVAETMAEIEADTRTRVRVKGQFSERVTGNLLWATFDHATSRPVDGVPDPHIHKHVFCINVTRDPVEGRLKALDLGAVKRDSLLHQESFHSRVASKLRAAGIHTERNSQNYDVAGFSRTTVQKFSNRTAEIEEAAHELGITSAAEKAELGAKVRSSKRSDVPMQELRGLWRDRLDENETTVIGRIARGEARSRVPDVSAAQAVDHAIEHCFSRESVTSLPRFTAEALRHSLGSATVEEIRAEIASRPEILTTTVDGRVLCSTRAVMAEEQSMVAYARDGRGTCSPLVSPFRRNIADERLSEEQCRAAQSCWSSTDRVVLIRGAAGTGKTTLMSEIVRGIEEDGGKVFACAPSAAASRGVQRSEGFESADTLSRLLVDKSLQASIRGQTIWLDEGGLCGVRSLNRLFQLAEQLDSRIIITSDTAQHGPVDRGDAVLILERQSGCQAASITKIRRQANAEYRSAVADLSEGRTDAAFETLDKLGFIKEAGQDRYKLLASEYLKAVDDRKSVLCVAPTWRECELVTAEVRVGLRERGKLTGPERPFASLKDLHATAAEKADPVFYEPGQVVAFTQHAPALKRGEKLTVLGLDPSGTSVIARRTSGESLELPLKYSDRWNLYQQKSIALSVGDKVRISQNGYDLSGKHRLDNGAIHEVAGFTKGGDLKLANGWVASKEFGFIANGIATTSHSAQGRTVDRCVVAQSSESFTASNREQFYVSCSRAKESLVVFTDNKAELREAVRASGRRLSATEVFDTPDPVVSRAVLNARLRAHAEASVARSVEALRERYGEAQHLGAHREPQPTGAEHGR